ncbi:MAG: TonB family protein [Porticoccaceae bacterium]|nr:TonB family protein [Porticoccaceae bacterium]
MIYTQSLQQSRSLRWSSAFVFVTAIYSGAALLSMNWSSRAPTIAAPPMAAMLIDLAPMPSAPPTPPRALPVAPQQAEIPPPPRPQPQPEIEPLPELPVLKQAAALLPPKPEPLEEEISEPIDDEQVAQEESAPATFESPPDDRVAAPMEGSVSLLPSTARLTWQSALLGHLEKHKRYPRQARRRRQEAVVYVHVTITRDGTVVDCHLSQPSTYTILNRETLALIARAQPLPAPPEDVVGKTIEFVVPVAFALKT